MPRRSRPWMRTRDKDCWYTTHNKKKVCLFVYGKENEAAAWKKWDELKAGKMPQPDRPVYLPPPVPIGTNSITVQQAIDAFLADATGRVTPRTLAVYQLMLRAVRVRFGDRPAATLTIPEVEQYSRNPDRPSNRQKGAWTESTRSTFLALMIRVFRHAERCRLIDRSPLTGLRRPPVASRAADCTLTQDEFDRLLAHAAKPIRPMLRFLWLTGCRPSEAAQIEQTDVNWELGLVLIRKHKTMKKGKKRVVYLNDEAKTLLRERADKRPTGPLFVNRLLRQWTSVTMTSSMKRACERAGLKGKVLYGLRHSFATRALVSGIPDSHVSALMGNSVEMLHKHYSHLTEQSRTLADAVKKVR